MEMLKPDILKDNSIKRILKTNKTNGSGRWLIETTKSKLNKAQKHIDKILNTMEAFGDVCTSSRINQSLAHKDIVQLSKGYTEVYDYIKPKDHKLYQNPPNVNPRMISYNLHIKAKTPNYNQHIQK